MTSFVVWGASPLSSAVNWLSRTTYGARQTVKDAASAQAVTVGQPIGFLLTLTRAA